MSNSKEYVTGRLAGTDSTPSEYTPGGAIKRVVAVPRNGLPDPVPYVYHGNGESAREYEVEQRIRAAQAAAQRRRREAVRADLANRQSWRTLLNPTVTVELGAIPYAPGKQPQRRPDAHVERCDGCGYLTTKCSCKIIDRRPQP